MINLSSFIAFHARRTPDRCALKYRGQEISYAAFDQRIRMVSGWLASRGIAPDDVIAVLMKNSPAFLDIAFAASHIGVVFLPINFRLASDEVAYIVENSGARVLIADEELGSNAAGPAPIVSVDEAAQSNATRLAPDAKPAAAVRRLPSDLMRLMYTSGTTDRPKGVMLTYENFYWKSADHVLALGLNRDTRLLVAGPLYHVGALDLPGIAVLWHGGMLSIHRNFEPEQALAAIEMEKLTAAWFAPVMTTAILTCPTRDRYDVSSLRWAIGGGEKTPEVRIRAFSDYFKNARYIDAYGLTETCGGDTFMEAGRDPVARIVADFDLDMGNGAAGRSDFGDLEPGLHEGVAAAGFGQTVSVDVTGIGEILREGANAGFRSFFAAADCCGSEKSERAFSRIRSCFGVLSFESRSRSACAVRSTTTSGFTPPSLIGFRSGYV